jgi:hypothetical protein
VSVPVHFALGFGSGAAERAREQRRDLIKDGLLKGVSFFSSANAYPLSVFSVLPYDSRLEKTLSQRRYCCA